MMAPNAFLVVLMSLLGGASGSHLLDYASTDLYWKSKGVVVSHEAMAAELKAANPQDIGRLIAQLGSPEAPVRESASKQIAQLGPSVIPQLETALNAADPETAASVKTLIAQINTASKAQAVRKLMAIRTLGELGKPEALPVLQPLAGSREMFVAEYARRSIAQINKDKYSITTATPEQRTADLALLPGGVRAVISTSILTPGQQPKSIDRMIDDLKLPANFGPFGQPAAGQAPQPPDKNEIKAEITKHILQIAEKVGDVRLDCVTFGLAGDVGPNAGFMTLIVRGEYDAPALVAFLKEMAQGQGFNDLKPENVAGTEVYRPDDNVAFFFPSNDRFIFIAGANKDMLPVNELLDAFRTGKGKLADDAEMAPLLKALDPALPMTGVVKMTPAYKQAPILNAFEVIRLSAKPAAAVNDLPTMDLRIEGDGSDAAAVKDAVTQVNNGVQMILNEAKRAPAPFAEMIKPMVQMLETLKCDAAEKQATLTMKVTSDPAVLAFPFLMFGARHAEVAPPPVAPVPQPIQPQP